MNLRQNGLVLILATALLGIAAQWAGDPGTGEPVGGAAGGCWCWAWPTSAGCVPGPP